MTTPLGRQVRLLLDESSDALPLSAIVLLADDFVHESSSSASPETDALAHVEEELQQIYHEYTDHKSFLPTAVVLTVLFRLAPVLPATSIISNWFDPLLRPALREPRLPADAVTYAKELIICALHRTDEEKVREFRRRLLDLYLLDAFNESSRNDVLEWAELPEDEREKRTRWKANLEDILVQFGNERPKDLMTEINDHFQAPSSRLQLLMLLNQYTSHPSFLSSSPVLAAHPLISSVLYSLLLDNSSTVCTMGLTVIVKVLPIFAVHACEDLKRLLPSLMAVLARIVCWKERTRPEHQDSALLEVDEDPEDQHIPEDIDAPEILDLRDDLGWQRLELSFNATDSSAPSPRQLFTTLYYLFPCNVLRFLRSPSHYLAMYDLASPYAASWDDALDEDQIRSKSESLVRGHILHPFVIWRDYKSELALPDFWAHHDVARIMSEAAMLDLRNATLGVRARHPERAATSGTNTPAASVLLRSDNDDDHDNDNAVSSPRSVRPERERPLVSLQDMINTSVALKSNVDVEIVDSVSSWPTSLFPTATSSPAKGQLALPPESLSAEAHRESDQIPGHVLEAMAGLQRDVLLLRNELNFELWLSRENVKHIGRLYQDRILSKNAEAERQNLHNSLRKYRAQVQALERELRDHKQQSLSQKNKYADWNTELQKKLHNFREEKKSWISEAAALRSAEKEAQARFEAQGKLLAAATKEVFEHQTRWKENQHKIDRLRDYEKQIEQDLKMQKLWDDDFRKFNERGEQIELMSSEYRKMQMRLESFEKTQVVLDEQARAYRRQIQTLEAQLTLTNRKLESSGRQMPSATIASFAKEKRVLTEANKQLREENAELREEVEEVNAMVEMLKNRVAGRKGLVSQPGQSPLLSPALRGSPSLPTLG
ncbi:hypothetical protein PLICRDRAFT_111127 [Plicaturopsis crispa FD-325 SS-3]|nr:hypothetical protein PLICRDRAFT_111127 [Plicaturopsis crispa FD-325 SS-3]